ERLVEEIRLRAERELAEERTRTTAEETAIHEARDRKAAQLKSEGRRVAEIDGARERALTVAAAKFQARKKVYEAQETRTGEMLEQVRGLLADYTRSAEYPQVLRKMFSLATERLGKQIKVSGRAEDAAVLRSVGGKSYDETPLRIVGGLVAETTDGARRLNLSFDELLRLREDEVRTILAA
ncbi:MAG TPA: V-type ATP synthase subunit E family protein, partial [Thermoplasmata archaeon]